MAAFDSGESSKTGQSLEIWGYDLSHLFEFEDLSGKIWQYKLYNSLKFDEDALGRILLDNRVRNSKVMVVSVGGLAGTGNSFLLNVFLKYLKNLGKPDWMVNPDVPLTGFASNEDRTKSATTTTVGIYMWSEPFFITIPSGEEVCVILIDTKGIHRYETSTLRETESNKLQIFNMLVSSIYLFSTDFIFASEARLKYITDCGKSALEFYKRKPYQTFYFLIRDWDQHSVSHPLENYPLGLMGDYDLMTELKKINLPLSECFEDLRCYTMPYPNFKIRKNFEVHLSDVDPAFKNSLKVLTEHLFSPKNVVVKEINGKQVTGLELFLYIKSYSKVLLGGFPAENDWALVANSIRRRINHGDFRNVPFEIRDEYTEAVTNALCRIRDRQYGNVLKGVKDKFEMKVIPEPCDLIKATEEARNMISEIEDAYFSKLIGLMETMEDEPWDMIGVDKTVAFYSRKMNEFMYGKDMHRITGLFLKAYHDVCYRKAIKKLRKMGVVNKIYEEELKGRLRKLYDNLVKEFRFCRKDLNLDQITSEKMKSELSKMAVNGNKKDDLAEFNSFLLATQNINAEPTVSEDKKSN